MIKFALSYFSVRLSVFVIIPLKIQLEVNIYIRIILLFHIHI